MVQINQRWPKVYRFTNGTSKFLPIIILPFIFFGFNEFLKNEFLSSFIFVAMGVVIYAICEVWMPKIPHLIKLNVESVSLYRRYFLFFSRETRISVSDITAIRINWILSRSTKYYVITLTKENKSFEKIYFPVISNKNFTGIANSNIPFVVGRFYISLKLILTERN